VGTPAHEVFHAPQNEEGLLSLESSSLKVKEIGKQLGFEKRVLLFPIFKMCVGTSPRNYANGT